MSGTPWSRLTGHSYLAVFLVLAFPVVAGAAQQWPILSHDIQATVEPVHNRLRVVDTIQLAAPPDAAEPLHLLLHRDLAVESVVLDETALRIKESLNFNPRHFWRRPDYEGLADFAVAREITVSPPDGGWPAGPRLTLRYAGAVYDSLRPPEVAYGRSFETTSGLIDERGAFLAGSTFWIPWSGEDLFTYRLRTSVPSGWESVSQGTWVGRRTTDEQRVESLWAVVDPTTEAYLIAGPYTVRQVRHGEVTVYTFTYENTPEDLCRTYLDATGDYLRMYEDMIGPYPFGKFAMVENWWQTGFGMPSFTLLGDRVIRLPFIVDTSYGHEILHNWWGNGVFVDYEEGNWCEGLTSYLADYTYKTRESDRAARDYRLGQLQAYLDYAGAGGKDFSLRRFTERDSPETQAVGYGKTMMVFHMARGLLGDEVFFEGLKRFYRDYRFRKASWDDVVQSFEAVSNRSLAGWFEQWIGRPGAPVLSVLLLERDRDRVRIELKQKEPFYELRVPIRYEAGGEVRSKQVHLDTAAISVDLESNTRWVAIDPGFDIFRKLHRAEIPPALSQVLGMDSTVVVVGSRCAPDLAAAFRELAAEWSRNHNQIVLDEADFESPGGRGVWLFGEGDLVDALFRENRAFGRTPRNLLRDAVNGGKSIVACFQDPDDEEIPWTVVLPAEASVVPALGRKLPHYGRYSYLVFEGETNVDKARWVVESSPLRLDLSEESQ